MDGSVEKDMTETVAKLKEMLSDEEKSAVNKSFNREINLWQVKHKKKIPPAIKQVLNLRVMWSKCAEKLEDCAKEVKGDFIYILDLMLECIGEQGQTEADIEKEEVMLLTVFKKKKLDNSPFCLATYTPILDSHDSSSEPCYTTPQTIYLKCRKRQGVA